LIALIYLYCIDDQPEKRTRFVPTIQYMATTSTTKT